MTTKKVKLKLISKAIVTYLCLGFAINAYSQITVRENNKATVEEKTPKLIVFDSMTNIIALLPLEPVVNYTKYIGQTLFFLPKSQNYKSDSDIVLSIYEKPIGQSIDYLFTKNKPRGGKQQTTAIYKACGKQKSETCRDSVENRYFTILDIEGEVREGMGFKKLENWPYGFHPETLEFTLKNESNGDILFWRVAVNRRINSLAFDNLNSNSKQPFLLVSYFEKQKKTYQNQNFIAKGLNLRNSPSSIKEKMKNIVDINTGKVVELEEGEVWHCEVNLLDSDVSPFLASFCFLRNGDRKIMFRLESEDIKTFFMTEEEFRQMMDNRQKIAEKQEQEREEAKQRKEQEEKRKEEEEIQRRESEKSDIDRILNLQTRPDYGVKYCIQTIYNKLNTSSFYFQGFLRHEIGLSEQGEPDYKLKNGIGTIKTTYMKSIIQGNVDYNAYKVYIQYSVFPIEDDFFVEKLDIWGNWESVAKIFILYYPASFNIEYLKNNKTEVTSYYIGDRASFTSEMIDGRLIGRIKVRCSAERNRKTFINEYELKKQEFNQQK